MIYRVPLIYTALLAPTSINCDAGNIIMKYTRSNRSLEESARHVY